MSPAKITFIKQKEVLNFTSYHILVNTKSNIANIYSVKKPQKEHVSPCFQAIIL